MARRGIRLAEARKDLLVGVLLRALKADALIALGRLTDAERLIAEAASAAEGLPITALAELERVRGKTFARLGHRRAADEHFNRAVRLLGGIGHLSAQREAEAEHAASITLPGAEPLIEQAGAAAGADRLASLAFTAGDGPDRQPPFPSLQHAATFFDLAGTPELLGREAFDLLAASGCVTGIALIARQKQHGTQVLCCAGWTPERARTRAKDRDSAGAVALGRSREREIELLMEPADTLAARSAVIAVRRLLNAARELDALRSAQKQRESLWPIDPLGESEGAICTSAETLEILSTAKRVASTTLPVLITGETGTGKELLARIIHRSSNRRERAFMPFNCSAVPREMLDSQLFGYRRGAFTGAHEQFPGVIRAATGGTLFLDEIGELGLELQPKLLRFLETGEIHPLGESKPSTVDVRIIAATNANLDRLVSDNKFREDLFYRLNVIRFRLPPLRERREEIPPMVRHFLHQYSEELQKGHLELSDETMEYLLLYRWPGNVRQLANEIRRLVALSDRDSVIPAACLDPEIRASRRTIPASEGSPPPANEVVVPIGQSLATAVNILERAAVTHALRACEGRVEAAAKMLGLSRKGLFLKRRRLGLTNGAA